MGRNEQIEYAEKHGIPVKQKQDKPYSYDENMWGNTGEGGEIENPELCPNFPNILGWCNTLEKTPEKHEKIEVYFEE
jgi:argininosuccinate synthase